MGIGGMYVHPDVEMRQTRAGGTGVRSAQRHHLEEYPYRMEYGTPNLPGIAGLNAGVKWVQARGRRRDPPPRDGALAPAARRPARDRRRDPVLRGRRAGPRAHQRALVQRRRALEAADVGTMLDVDDGIACRTGLHCAPMVHEHLGTDKIHGSVRFGIGPFNTAEQIETAIAAVGEIAELGRRR